jgi:hypothetical protein
MSTWPRAGWWMRAAVVFGVCLPWLASGPLAAGEPSSLPAFDLVALDAQVVTSIQLAAPGHWLLLSVRPGSSPSRTLLKSLSGGGDGKIAPARRVIVVDGTLDDARRMREATPDLAVSWFADPSHQALQALGLQGAPSVLGLRATSIAWRLQGAFGPKEVSALNGWVGLQATARP